MTDQYTLFDAKKPTEYICYTSTERDGQGVQTAMATMKSASNQTFIIKIGDVSSRVSHAHYMRLIDYLALSFEHGMSYREAIEAMINEVSCNR